MVITFTETFGVYRNSLDICDGRLFRKNDGCRRLSGPSLIRSERIQAPLLNAIRELRGGKSKINAGFAIIVHITTSINMRNNLKGDRIALVKHLLKPSEASLSKIIRIPEEQDSAEIAVQKCTRFLQCVQCHRLPTFAKNGTKKFN